MINAVVAYDKNRAIGMGSKFPWGLGLPDDLRHFRALTYGQAIIMGRKTFAAIGKPLPGRQNIVLSREPEELPGATVVHSMQEAYKAVKPHHETWVIGGGQIFQLAIDDIDRIHATEIDEAFPGADIFFPEIDMSQWREIEREHHVADDRNKYAFDFVTYERI